MVLLVSTLGYSNLERCGYMYLHYTLLYVAYDTNDSLATTLTILLQLSRCQPQLDVMLEDSDLGGICFIAGLLKIR